MQKLIAAALLGFAVAALMGCSSDREATTEKGAVEQMTDEAARQAVDHIQGPLEKARAARGQEEERQQGLADETKE